LNVLKPSVRILGRFFRNRDQNLKLLISRSLNKQDGVRRDEVTRIVYGVLRKEKLIEFIAGAYIKKKLSDSDFPTRLLLVCGIYLLYFSRSYPPHAVVNEIVDTAPARSKGFLNAVLRKVGREQEKIEGRISSLRDPMVRYSVSEEIVHNLRKVTPDVEDALAYLDREPVFHLRVNGLHPDYTEAERRLNRKGISTLFIKETGSFEIKDTGRVVREIIPGHDFYFQNSGSYAVSAVTAAFSGKYVLDGCAAPGTKSLTVSLIGPESEILAMDIHPRRLLMIRPFLNASGAGNINLVAGDMTAPPLQPGFDTILLDAPCTSSGTLRKNPDLKNKIADSGIKRNARLQKNILRSALNLAAGETVVIYAVCSFFEEETEGVTAHLFRQTGAVRLESAVVEKTLREIGYHTRPGEFGTYLLPHPRLNNDLFYISAVRKI